MATASFLSISRSILRPGIAHLATCLCITDYPPFWEDKGCWILHSLRPITGDCNPIYCMGKIKQFLCWGAEALPFLRDPYDLENEEPFGQLMTQPMQEQIVRAMGAFAVMACLAVACVHTPIQLARTMAPALFPLRLKLVDVLAELPADLLLFHVCLPLTLPHLQTR